MSYAQNVQKKLMLEEALRQDENTKIVNYKKFDADRINVLLVGDEHIGHKQFDRDLLMKILDNAYEKGWYLLHMGDGMETATRNSIGSGVYEQDEIVDKQINDFISIYQPFVDNNKLIGLLPGNHELRIYKDEGVNITRQVCRMMGAKYLGIAKAHYFKVGNQHYSLYTTHGASGAQMPHTKIKAAIDMERIIDVDIYAQGHLHQLSHHVRNYHKIDNKTRKIITNQKHFILTGSYLDYWNSYAQLKNKEPARKGSPILMLNGLEKQMKVSLQ